MKLRYLLSALAGAALLASCQEDEPVASYDLALKLDKSVVAVGSEGGSATVEVNSGEISWAATCSADWVEFSPASGKGTTKVTVTVGASDEDRTAEITLKADSIEKLITVIQTGNPHGLTADDPLNISEAVEICLKLADKAKTGKKYYVKGIISSIVEGFKDTGDYGNATFWLSDSGETKDFEVYRTLYFDNTKYGEYTGADKPDVGEGDEVVIYGLIMNYGGTAETSANESYLYSLKSNTEPAISCKEAEKVVGASETEAKFVIAPKNLTEGWTVTTDASWISEYTQSGAKDATEIVVKFAANTDPAPREATFTVKSAGAKDLVLTLKQGGYTASGTLDKPYTVAEVIAAIKDGSAAGNVYVKGIVSETTKYNFEKGKYNTASFWISDDGVYNNDLEKDFEAYSAYYLGGTLEAPTAADDINANFAIGDEVILYGAVTSYTSSSTGLTTYETASKKAKIYSINWAISDENGVGNADYPFNIAGAQKFIDDTQAAAMAAKDAGETLAIPDVCVKGKVSAVYSQYSAQYHTAIFWISEDGTFNGTEDKKKTTDFAHDFEAYSVYWLENKEWEEGMGTVKEGDDVILKGQYTIYNGLYETSSKKAYLYSLNGQTEDQPAEQVPALFLNEFDTLNKKIEIYNSTDQEVDMTGWILSKDETDWTIPAEHAKVPAKGFIVYTGKSDGTTDPTFGLSGTKGFVVVLRKGETIVDKVDNSSAREGGIVAIEDGKSWGRETDGAEKFVIFDTPTIGESNGAEPAPTPLTITEILALDKGAEFTAQECLVVAKTTKGVVVSDGAKAVYAYGTQVGNVNIGDKIVFAGKKTVFNGVHELESLSGVEVKSTGNAVTYPDPKDITAEVTTYTNTEAEYVSLTGQLAVSGTYYNLTIEGVDSATKMGSIVYPIAALNAADFDGKVITVTGYYNGLSGSDRYVNVIATKIEEPEAASGSTGGIPDYDPLTGFTW